jgi:hypothetical protein
VQLRRLVTEFPRIEPIAYTFTYADTASYEEEIEEWFSYADAEFTRLRNAQETFERRWKKFETRSWSVADQDTQEAFLKREIIGLQATDLRRRCKSLQTLLHISLGVWDETAGVENSVVDSSEPDVGAKGNTKGKTVATKTQVEFVRKGVVLITECGGVSQIYELLKRAFDRLLYVEPLGASSPLIMAGVMMFVSPRYLIPRSLSFTMRFLMLPPFCMSSLKALEMIWRASLLHTKN